MASSRLWKRWLSLNTSGVLIFKKVFNVNKISLSSKQERREWAEEQQAGDNILHRERTSKTMSNSSLRKWMWIYCLNESDPIHHLPMNDRSFNTICVLFLCPQIWHFKETEKHRNPSKTNLLSQQLLLIYMWVTERKLRRLFLKNMWHFIRKQDHEVFHFR